MQPHAGPDGGSSTIDTDHDWLCDFTESFDQSDPTRADTDEDGLPDGIEGQYAFSPIDDQDPGFGRVVYLQATPGARAQLDLHVLVDGAGESFGGELAAWNSIEPSWPSVSQFFTGAIAVSAEPADHVFGFPENGDHIDSIVGETRLGYRLSFAYTEPTAGECAQALAFTYAIKRQDGARFGTSNYLLVITPSTETIPWCPATTCL